MREQENIANPKPPKPPPRGFVNPRKVKIISFAVITICLVASTLTSILAVWDFTKSDAVWRAFATFIIVAVATGVFAFVNEKFGD